MNSDSLVVHGTVVVDDTTMTVVAGVCTVVSIGDWTVPVVDGDRFSSEACSMLVEADLTLIIGVTDTPVIWLSFMLVEADSILLGEVAGTCAVAVRLCCSLAIEFLACGDACRGFP